jgi:hypothetical protein
VKFPIGAHGTRGALIFVPSLPALRFVRFTIGALKSNFQQYKNIFLKNSKLSQNVVPARQ